MSCTFEKKDLAEEIKPLLWTRNLERPYILQVGKETIFVKTPPKRMKRSTKYKEINVCLLKRKVLRIL